MLGISLQDVKIMMTPDGMANFIISQIQGMTDPGAANNAFYSALCTYVEANMDVTYAWTGALTSPPFTKDPMTVLSCKVKTSGTLTPSGATNPGDALSMFSAILNQNAALWTVIWPVGFTLTPAFIIPTITITPSGATDMNSAWLAVATQIIAGLKSATPAATGSHASFVGAAAFSEIS